MLRALVVLLAAANLLFFAWAQGWLSPLMAAPHQGEREPERLAAQVRPELVRIVRTPVSAAAGAAKSACLEAGPFDDTDIGIAEAALLAAGVPASGWVRDTLQQRASWLVYMGRFADAAGLRAKGDELRRLKADFEEVRGPPDLVPGIMLSRHDTEGAAQASLTQWTQRGVRTARVVSVPAAPPQFWMRVARPDDELQARLLALKPPAMSQPFAACKPR